MENIAALVQSCEEEYGIKIIYGNEVHLKHVKRLRKKLYALKKWEKVVFVHGIGKRKHPVQKSIELLEKYMDKLKEYTQKLYKCGKRNSYSKSSQSTNARIVRTVLSKETVSKETTARYHLKKETKFFRFQKSL